MTPKPAVVINPYRHLARRPEPRGIDWSVAAMWALIVGLACAEGAFAIYGFLHALTEFGNKLTELIS